MLEVFQRQVQLRLIERNRQLLNERIMGLIVWSAHPLHFANEIHVDKTIRLNSQALVVLRREAQAKIEGISRVQTYNEDAVAKSGAHRSTGESRNNKK